MSNDTPEDRRAVARRKTVRAAITLFDSPHSPIPVVLIDLSENGARINVPNIDLVPDGFRLRVEAEALERECIVIWRRDAEMGVKFV